MLAFFLSVKQKGSHFTHSRIKYTLSLLTDDTKPSGAVDSFEGRNAIQKNLDRLEEWAHVNLVKFKKAKCKVLHPHQGNSLYQYRLGDEQTESSPEKNWEKLVDEKFNTSLGSEQVTILYHMFHEHTCMNSHLQSFTSLFRYLMLSYAFKRY